MAGRWKDVATGTVREVTTDELLSAVRGHRLAEIRRSRGLTQHHLAEKMGVSQSQVYEIERGSIAEREALARYAIALGGRLRQAIHFDDGDIAVVE
ncbi:helix-turn-helix domain-containing protein [Amycolatopsis acidiphila]|uniref:Helix-turn-helix transcriptional regulator n=1 Tax=Amycolatopsis acidiphila TaxID=715473 RepID=A0A557ZYW7_9PSEU|nr:helix-turn-helix transcriptional regulator [Amycolatopsis acidiphila]TVT17206.1 helix-turn-helix transcriptional regulator [Amycolatopsis acidiphila]UIJ58091.1 helix-turn-helix domain-containing protein [Amycolatopsis acidiphila]GHG70139.1 hypothetical protein GCM10017788_30900 [Amycolatopsis acidiphila]